MNLFSYSKDRGSETSGVWGVAGAVAYYSTPGVRPPAAVKINKAYKDEINLKKGALTENIPQSHSWWGWACSYWNLEKLYSLLQEPWANTRNLKDPLGKVFQSPVSWWIQNVPGYDSTGARWGSVSDCHSFLHSTDGFDEAETSLVCLFVFFFRTFQSIKKPT